MNNTKIYIGNLPYKLSEAQLGDYFNSFGEITDLVIIKDRDTGRSKGFGFITFGEQSSAQEALSMNEKDIEGKKIVVSMAKPQEKRTGGGGRGGAGGGRGGFGGGAGGGGRGGFGGGRDRF